jgi:pimeloyl-ACP methyl ester carboxylesterase
MPGYGYSGKPSTTGWGPERIARAWAELMKRLGYERYVASGGDWGGQIVDLMAAQAPPGLIGIHTNFPGAVRDDVTASVLDNITHYWLTNSGISSGLLYKENTASFFGPKGVTIPVAVSVYPDELYQVPRSWAEKAYPKLIHYNKLDKGGHFAAWEQPASFTEEVRTGLRSLR